MTAKHEIDTLLALVHANIYKLEHGQSIRKEHIEETLIARTNLLVRSLAENIARPNASEAAMIECHAIRLASLALCIALDANKNFE